MFEFTLSKVNMLIFVTAIAVVVIFFMNTLNDNLKTRQSYELAFKIGKEIKSVIDADSYCSIKFIDIPKSIRINQGTSSLYSINYVLGFQTYSLQDNDSLIIYITDYRKDKILGAFNLDYEGKINFYESVYTGPNYVFYESENENKVLFDPRKLNTNESRIMIIKNVKNQEVNYYLLPCEKRNNIDTCKNFVCDADSFDPDNDIICKQNFCTAVLN